MIDKQVREALIEYQCKCVRLDKVKIPVIGGLIGLFSKRLSYMPRMHFVTARVGSGSSSIVAERWYFRGDDLHSAYDTRQIFCSRPDDCTRTVLHEDRFSSVVAKRVGGWLSWMKAEKPKPIHRPVSQSPFLKLLRSLPPDERIKHYRRLQLAGAI